MIFRVNVKSTVRISVPGVNERQMRQWGERAIDVMKARITRGVNVNDASASPLSRSYAKAKRRLGKPAIRNMTLTGDLLNSLKVTRAANGSVRVGFASRKENIKAHANQEREEMFGLSRADQAEILRQLQAEWNRNFLGAVAITAVGVGVFSASYPSAQLASNIIVMTPATYMRMAA